MAKKTLSQNLWIKRKESDIFFINAKKKGYRARSAYKLLEIDKKFNVIKKNKNYIDLGAAPGSWSQVLVEKISKNANYKEVKIFSIDIKDIEPISGIITIKDDISNLTERNKYFKRNSINLVLSDMAPKSTGHRFTDQTKAKSLSKIAFEFANNYLSLNGNFVCKLLGGHYDKTLILEARKKFKFVQLFKPKSSRNESKEIFLICMGFNNLQYRKITLNS